jgi:hypothetical protein
VDKTGSGEFLVEDFGISGVKSSGSFFYHSFEHMGCTC